METLFIPTENDFRRWVKEAVQEFLQNPKPSELEPVKKEDDFTSRKHIANFLKISLVTLNDWVKRGLPAHKQRGKVYFDKSEVTQYIKTNKVGQLKFTTKFQKLRKEIA